MANATNDSIELRFCDLCGLSIPEKEVEAGTTRSVGDKVVGPCCLSKLLDGLPAPGAARPEGPGQRIGAAILVATTVLLAAIVGAALYLDFRAGVRDPAAAIDRVGGRLDVLQGLVDGQERVLRAYGEGIVRDVVAGLQPGLDRLAADFDKVRAEMPKPERGLGALEARVASLGNRIGDLVARQAAIETQVAKSLGAVRAELGNVDKSLVDLRRRSVALGDAAAKAVPGAAARKVETLPETLGRKVDQLRNEDPSVRWSAVDELVRSGDKRVVPYLLPMLKDADPFVRRLCAEGLAQVGDASVAGALIDALEDKESIVRESAYQTLVKLAGTRISFDPDGSESARRNAVRKWRQWWKGHAKG